MIIQDRLVSIQRKVLQLHLTFSRRYKIVILEKKSYLQNVDLFRKVPKNQRLFFMPFIFDKIR